MWRSGKKHGQGTKTLKDGTVFKGTWCDGERKEWNDFNLENKALNLFSER